MRTQRSAWGSHTFTVDDTLVDHSSIVLVAPTAADGVSPWSLTLARDVSEVPLKGYVDGALRELAMSLSGFRLMSRDDKATLGGLPAMRIAHQALTPEGHEVFQFQGFGADGRPGGIVVVTATALAGHEAPAKAAFEQLWMSWRAV